jgi:hypothetical protein
VLLNLWDSTNTDVIGLAGSSMPVATPHNSERYTENQLHGGVGVAEIVRTGVPLHAELLVFGEPS